MKLPIVKILIALCVVAGIFWVAASLQKNKEVEKVQKQTFENRDKLIRDYSPTLGPDDAKVVLVEFLDPECEACGGMYPIVKKLMQEYEGKLQLVIRYMPLHGNSIYAANVLEIARKEGKYWQAMETLFLRQGEWASHHAPKPELIKDYMAELSVDISGIENTMLNDRILEQIKADKEDGKALGVRRTPTFFVNGKMLDQIGYEPLKSEIQSALGQE